MKSVSHYAEVTFKLLIICVTCNHCWIKFFTLFQSEVHLSQSLQLSRICPPWWRVLHLAASVTSNRGCCSAEWQWGGTGVGQGLIHQAWPASLYFCCASIPFSPLWCNITAPPSVRRGISPSIKRGWNQGCWNWSIHSHYILMFHLRDFFGIKIKIWKETTCPPVYLRTCVPLAVGEWLKSLFNGMVSGWRFKMHTAHSSQVLRPQREELMSMLTNTEKSLSTTCLILWFQHSLSIPRSFEEPLLGRGVFYIFKWAMYCCAKLSYNDVSSLELSRLLFSTVKPYAAKNMDFIIESSTKAAGINTWFDLNIIELPVGRMCGTTGEQFWCGGWVYVSKKKDLGIYAQSCNISYISLFAKLTRGSPGGGGEIIIEWC